MPSAWFDFDLSRFPRNPTDYQYVHSKLPRTKELNIFVGRVAKLRNANFPRLISEQFSWFPDKYVRTLTRMSPKIKCPTKNSLERSQRVLCDAGVVSKVHPGPDGAEYERVAVAPARHANRPRRLQDAAVLQPANLERETHKLLHKSENCLKIH